MGYTNVKRYQLGLPVWRALGNTVETNLEGFRYVFKNDKTAVFDDVRSQEEFRASTVPGAVNVRSQRQGVWGLHMDQGTRVIIFGRNAQEGRTVAEEIAKNYWNSSYFGGTFDELNRAGLW